MRAQLLHTLNVFRRQLYTSRNDNEIDDKTLNDVLTLLDAIEIILRDADGGKAQATT